MDFLFQEKNNKFKWGSFLWFLLIVFLVFTLVIYLLFPGIFSGPEVKRIPLIPHEEPNIKLNNEEKACELIIHNPVKGQMTL
jgi:hypothetical protein